MNAEHTGLTWLIFALMTVSMWGLYGVFLHNGQIHMGDPINGRYKAFLFVGLAYFLTAVLDPLVALKLGDASWTFPVSGMFWSLLAGIVGAVGAFCVLLAFAQRFCSTGEVVPVLLFCPLFPDLLRLPFGTEQHFRPACADACPDPVSKAARLPFGFHSGARDFI